MKKILLIILATAGIAFVQAQENVQFGLKSGLNFASLNGDSSDEINLDPRIGFHIGGFVEIPVSEKFSFQPELLYSTQGAKLKDTDDFGAGLGDVEIDGVFKLDYINIPLMAKFYAAEGFSIEAGPQIGFLVSSESETDATFNNGQTISNKEDLKEFTSSIDFGINLGIGYKLESGLNFGARYNLGLSNVNDGDGSGGVKDRNGVFQISIGYLFK